MHWKLLRLLRLDIIFILSDGGVDIANPPRQLSFEHIVEHHRSLGSAMNKIQEMD